MKGMAVASPFDPSRIDLCYLAPGATPAHVYSTGAGWYPTALLESWDVLTGEFATAPVMVATKNSPPILTEPGTGAVGASPEPTPPPPPHHLPGPIEVAPGLLGGAVGAAVPVAPPGPAPAAPAPGPAPAGPVPAAVPEIEHAAATAGGEAPHTLASVLHGPAGLGGLTPFGPKPRLDVFAVGTDLAMRHQVLWGGELSKTPGWENLGGIFISAPAVATAFGEARMDVFGVGLDRALYQKTWDGKRWTPDWQSLGGIFSSDTSAVSWAQGRLDLFIRDADFTLRHRAYDGTNWLNDWQNLGGSLASAPAAVTWGVDRIDVLAISHTGTLIHRWWDGMIWNDWEDFGPPGQGLTLIGTPSAVSIAPHRIDVLALGSDGNCYHYWFVNGQWNGPMALGTGETITDCAAFVTGPGALRAFKAGAGGRILTATFDGTTWGSWDQTGMHLMLPTQYVFSVDLVQVDTARSLNADTDTAQATVIVGDAPPLTAVQSIDAIGGTHPKQWQTNLLAFGPVTVDLSDSVVFNYSIINAGSKTDQVQSTMTTAGKQLAAWAVQSISASLVSGLTEIESVEIGAVSSAVPVVGPLLGILGAWLISELGQLLDADHCDGPVALEQVVLLGRDLYQQTAAGPHRVTTTHPGTDSNWGCGSNSVYEVSWSITRV